MSLPARIHDFQPSTPAKSGEVDEEFNQWVNLFNGTTQSQSIRVRNNDINFAVARFDALGASGNILELYKSGAALVNFENSGRMNSLVATGTAPITVASTTKCPNLNADLLDDLEATAFARLASDASAWSIGWFYDLAPGATETEQSVHSVIVPDFHLLFQAWRIHAIWSGGSSSGETLTFTIKRFNLSGTPQTDIGTITLGGTKNARANFDIVSPVSLSAGDHLVPYLTTRTGSITKTKITIGLSGYQRFGAPS